MKVAVLSESSADEAAIRILVDGLLGRPSQTIALNQFAKRSSAYSLWSSGIFIFKPPRKPS